MSSKERSTIKYNGWVNGLQFHVLFNSISDISWQWEGDNDMLSATEPELWLKKILPQVGIEPGTAGLLITRSEELLRSAYISIQQSSR